MVINGDQDDQKQNSVLHKPACWSTNLGENQEPRELRRILYQDGTQRQKDARVVDGVWDGVWDGGEGEAVIHKDKHDHS